jgi:hypothetical protein
VKVLAGVAAILVLGGCTRTILLEEDGGLRRLDGAVDSSSADTTVPPDASSDTGLPMGKCSVPSAVDLLFVVDNSNSMGEEQALLAAQLPTFIDVLESPVDADGDGEGDYPPIEDIHIGVVTSDMGTGGFAVPTCTESNFGDDGVLRTTGNTAIAGCMATYPPFLSYRAGGDPEVFAADVACVAVVGTGGCGFEQQLEAGLKAVTASTSSIAFGMGTTGHADGANSGFLRPDSMLGVIFVTDEEDCSALDPELFNPTSSVYSGDLNLRCFSFPGAVHPLERYIDGFRALRADRPDLFTLAVIAGVPSDLAPSGVTDRAELDRILADPRMAEEIDPAMPTRLRPSCNEPGFGYAFPPRRLVGLARAFPEQSVVASICQPDWTGAIRTIGATVGRRACASYLE